MTEAITPRARFAPLKPSRAFEDVVAEIRLALQDGGVSVGSRLPSERDLAEQFGVSRNTIREALRSLENAGLVRMRKGPTGGTFIATPNGGAVVTGVSDMFHAGSIDPEHLVQAREWLADVIVHVACKRATAEDIAALNANIDATEQALKDGDFETRVTHNMDFHRLLARMTGNPLMATFMESLLQVVDDFIRRLGDNRNEHVIASRRRFMKRFAAGDADGAVAEMRQMLERTQAEYFSRASPPQAARSKR